MRYLIIFLLLAACGSDQNSESQQCTHTAETTWSSSETAETFNFSEIEIGVPFNVQISDSGTVACEVSILIPNDKCSSEMTVSSVTNESTPLCEQFGSFKRYFIQDSQIILCDESNCYNFPNQN